MQKALVLGANGQLGTAVIKSLGAAGWHITAAGRRPIHALQERGISATIDSNGKTPLQIFAELGHTVDAVFDPTAYTANDAAQLIAAKSKFGSAVVMSSCSVYADAQGRSLDEAKLGGFPVFSEPMTEQTPTVPAGPETYSTHKVAMEQELRATNLPITILRPCAIYGINATHPREWWLIKRALDGRSAIPIAYDGKSIFHTSSEQGIAALAEICMTNPAQRILNVADATPFTVTQIAHAIEAVIDRPIPLHPFSGPPKGSLGASPWSVPLPYTLNCDAAKALGWKSKSYQNSIGDYCAWILDVAKGGAWQNQFRAFTNYDVNPFDYAAEDEFMG